MTKILLVEDDKSLREIYGVRLLAEGYDIVSAGDGEEALAMAIKERPQLIVSDVMMPKISGFDMLDILRSTTETKDIKVIMMTALSSEDQRERGESLGADRYLVKSQVGIEDVVRTVHEVLGDTPTTVTTGNVFAGPPKAPVPASPGQPGPAPQSPTTPGVQPASPQSNPVGQPSAPAPTSAPSAQPQPPVSPTPAPSQPAPTSQPQPVAPATPTPAPTTGNLPQPTAPFSTNRPANLGDRIIHPVNNTTPKTDFGNLMAQELNDSNPTPKAAVPQPAPASPSQPSQPNPTPQPPTAPATQPTSVAPASTPQFEQTPRPPQPPVPPSM